MVGRRGKSGLALYWWGVRGRVSSRRGRPDQMGCHHAARTEPAQKAEREHDRDAANRAGSRGVERTAAGGRHSDGERLLRRRLDARIAHLQREELVHEGRERSLQSGDEDLGDNDPQRHEHELGGVDQEEGREHLDCEADDPAAVHLLAADSVGQEDEQRDGDRLQHGTGDHGGHNRVPAHPQDRRTAEVPL